MENMKGFYADKKRIHCNNIKLHRATRSDVGIVGSSHSTLINRLSNQLEQKRQKENRIIKQDEFKQFEQGTTYNAKIWQKKAQELQKEERLMKKQMVRMSELSKQYKNAKTAVQIKYDALLRQYERQIEDIKILDEKLTASNQLNTYLIKITENTLSILPHYQTNCQKLQSYLSTVNKKLKNTGLKDQTEQNLKIVMEDMCHHLSSFKNQVDSMHSYQKKMMNSLTQAHNQTKKVSQRLSAISNISLQQLVSFKQEIEQLNDTFYPYDPNDTTYNHTVEKNLTFQSSINQFTFIPESASRINKIFTQVSLLFEQHIHLLQNQKMEYQFTKNKKLLLCQECSMCDNYEKIVSQTFSIVRQAFKQIKFQFLKEIRQISDANQIPILI